MTKDVDIIEKKTVFQGYFRIDRYRLRHRTYAGGWTGIMTREIFERGHAVGILLYDPDADMVGLIEQFRPGALAAGWEPWLIEVVAGIIEEDESPENVAIRECQEESGTDPIDLIPVCRYLATPGGSSETLQLYCGRIDIRTLSGTHGLVEENEDIRTLAVPAAEAIGWLAQGRIVNATAIIALQWLALNREELRKRWTS
ncbi:MAG: NUDIX domain-containing protein [Rhodospirillaceae bacterium]|nr:NUDIX domain-containing protein [Rhodospirillaceae bacterium]